MVIGVSLCWIWYLNVGIFVCYGCMVKGGVGIIGVCFSSSYSLVKFVVVILWV